jgi:prolipoprotein diacylglyceryl transferase
MSVLLSIPSPSSGTLELGPLTIHMYGLTLLVAIAACVWITGTRFVNRGGEWDLIFRCAVWGVGAGIVGARLYHLATSWNEVPNQWWGPFAIWKGGLGIWGGVAAGCLAGGLVAKRAGADVWLLADCLAPGLLVAQAIGRLGNWWNQELYGRPTKLPWGLEIDPSHFGGNFWPAGTTFHPTFLYELLWNLFAAGLLVFVIERRFHPRPPGLFALYIALYSFGRFWIELVRVDAANHILGLRVNTWVSALVCIAGVVWFFLSQRRGGPPQKAPPAGPKMSVPGSTRVRPGG